MPGNKAVIQRQFPIVPFTNLLVSVCDICRRDLLLLEIYNVISVRESG